ncbi:MAG: hypothetical protein ACRD44_17610, partial [Bryobacteraceae bacterium]
MPVIAALVVAAVSAAGNRADYIGGTLPDVTRTLSGRLEASDVTFLYFRAGKHLVKVPYDAINLLEYGQTADRRYLEAILLSPVFLLARKRAHYLTIGYSDAAGLQQALVFKLDKNSVRTVLAVLEARTGRKV